MTINHTKIDVCLIALEETAMFRVVFCDVVQTLLVHEQLRLQWLPQPQDLRLERVCSCVCDV